MGHLTRLLAATLLVLVTGPAFADTPVGPMNYQGRLLDNAGIPVTGSYNFVVRVYDAASAGTLKYQENHNAVAVDDGVYNFLVGTQTKSGGDSTWSIELWNCCTNLFMEIVVNGEALSPRHRLAAAPYAFQATLALTTNNALALGGKTAAQYDSLLADICISSKGKWLDLVDKCLGVGSSFPGPALTHWSSLASDGNFGNLDLSRADISGISFDGADLSATVFHKTDYSVEGMSGANLRDTQWRSASAVDMSIYPVSSGTNLNGATFYDMDLYKWNLGSVSLANVAGFSAAEVSACPGALPGLWECRDQGLSNGNYFLLGPGVNLSANSAAAVSKFGSSYLNLGENALENMDLTDASFEGNVLVQNFTNMTLINANLNYTVMRSNIFDGLDLTNASFVGSVLDKPVFLSGAVFANNDFTNAGLSYVRFGKDVAGGKFKNATLKTVDFLQDVTQSDFSGAVLDEVAILGNTGSNIFDATRFYHGFQHGGVGTGSNTYAGGSTFNNLTFIGGSLIGDFTGATFTGPFNVSGLSAGPRLDLCGATFPLVNGVVPGWSIAMGGECPDGNDYTPCNVSPHMNPIPVNECTVGVP